MAASLFGRTLRRGKKRAAVLTGRDYVNLFGKNMFRAFAYAQNRYLLTYRGWKGDPKEGNISYLAAGLNIFNVLLNHARASRLQPDSAKWRAALGQKFKARIEKNLAKAKGIMEKALELIPDDPQARANLGRIYARMGQFPAALREVNAAIARWPDCAEAYVTLDAIRMIQNRRREGIAAYKKAIELKPAMWRPYFNLAQALGIVEGLKYEVWAKEAAPWRAKWIDRQIANLALRNIKRRKKVRAARAGNIPAKPYRLPLPYTAEQIKSMPPRSVALGFASAIDTLGSAMTMFQLAKKGVMKPEHYTHEFHCPDGSTRKYIPRSIGEFEKFINHFRKMSLMYRKEIKKRGFERVKGKYNADLSSGCSLRWFAPGEVAVNQREFAFRISQGKKRFPGFVVGSTALLIYPGGHERPLFGRITGGEMKLADLQKKCTVTLRRSK